MKNETHGATPNVQITVPGRDVVDVQVHEIARGGQLITQVEIDVIEKNGVEEVITVEVVQQTRPEPIRIEVNSRPVVFHHHQATGALIKADAIKQGVGIQQDFVLQEELPDGTGRIIGDEDEITLHEGMKFTAIRNDDNS